MDSGRHAWLVGCRSLVEPRRVQGSSSTWESFLEYVEDDELAHIPLNVLVGVLLLPGGREKSKSDSKLISGE